jgi:hypothetical protein
MSVFDLAAKNSHRNGSDKCPDEEGVMHDAAKKVVSPEMSSFLVISQHAATQFCG